MVRLLGAKLDGGFQGRQRAVQKDVGSKSSGRYVVCELNDGTW